MPHFGHRILGQEEYARRAAIEHGGGARFGHRVTGRALAAAATATTSEAPEVHEAYSVAVEEIERHLAANPTLFETLYLAEITRPGGPRLAAMRAFRTFVVAATATTGYREQYLGEIEAILADLAPRSEHEREHEREGEREQARLAEIAAREAAVAAREAAVLAVEEEHAARAAAAKPVEEAKPTGGRRKRQG